MVQYKRYQEGKTSFLTADVELYSAEKGQPTADLPVFMNPRMQINRDLSVLFLAAYLRKENIKFICEPLAGSGVRTLRYLNEVPGSFHAVMFDTNPLAIETALMNIENLGFQERCRVIRGDARLLLLTESRGKRFDFVDIDPFGSPAQFLNAAVQSLRPKRSILAMTATDMPALCGVWPKVAMRKYGGYSIRAPFTHEIAVRLLISLAYHVSGLNDRSIEPLASLSTDHYVRIWVRVLPTKTKSNIQSKDMGFIRFCPNCIAYDILTIKDIDAHYSFTHAITDCKGPIRIAGPLWIGPIFCPDFVRDAHSLLTEDWGFHRKSGKIINAMAEEIDLMDYLYTDLHALCDTYNLVSPRKNVVMEELIRIGYKATNTHFRPTAIRTDAPVSEIIQVLKTLSGDDD